MLLRESREKKVFADVDDILRLFVWNDNFFPECTALSAPEPTIRRYLFSFIFSFFFVPIFSMAASRGASRFAISAMAITSTSAFIPWRRNRPRVASLEPAITSPTPRQLSFTSLPIFFKEAISSAFPATLPEDHAAVSRLRTYFAAGDYYVWLYCDRDGNPTSWERYDVVRTEPRLVIEMSTKFDHEADYRTHHRMHVDLDAHLRAREDRDGWRVGFEYLHPEDGWTSFGTGENVQCFEEKFDVFALLAGEGEEGGERAEWDERVVRIEGREEVLRRPARHAYTEAWYGAQEYVGVAVWKEFKEHTFRLIERGREHLGSQHINVQC